MSINNLFFILGAGFLGGAVGLLIVYIRCDASVEKKGWESLLFLGLAVCIILCAACLIAATEARECPNCDIIVKCNYCEECGYQVRTEEYPKELFCSECGADIKANTNFCSHCGAAIKED